MLTIITILCVFIRMSELLKSLIPKNIKQTILNGALHPYKRDKGFRLVS
jgi:hypothetical protein